MSTIAFRLFAFAVCTTGFLAGCRGVPPAPAHAQTSAPRGEDEDDEGWLFDRLMGRGGSNSARSAPPRQPPTSGVIPASATEPATPPPVAPAKQEESGFDLEDLDPENVWKNVKKATGFGPDEGKAKRLMEEGNALFREKKYAEAGGKFKSAAGRWPDSPLEEDGMFMTAECYFFADKYPKAQDAYDNLLKKYDNSRYLDTAVKRLFAIGRFWEQTHDANPHWPVTPNLTDGKRPLFDARGNALKAYETIRLKDPTGPLSDDAVMATANSYFRAGRFEDASFHFDIIRKEYPNSEHQLTAHLLGLQAKRRMYQGSKYDDTPLKDSAEIADQTLKQFHRQLGPERRRVAAMRDQITEQKAERDWDMARYYDDKKCYGAARYYYGLLIKEYPLTKFAQQARQRIEEIRGEPDVPPDNFKWLTGMFPDEE